MGKKRTIFRMVIIGNGNYWEYVIAYDRYDYFPNTTLGYFYDAGQTFAYSKGKPTFEGSGLHTLLENLLEQKIQFKDIIGHLEQGKQAKGYISQTSEIKQYEITPIYFMLRDEMRVNDDLSSTKIINKLNYLLEFGDSFKYTIILLGAFFGFRKFYDIYYDYLNLKFYKNTKPIDSPPIKQEKVRLDPVEIEQTEPTRAQFSKKNIKECLRHILNAEQLEAIEDIYNKNEFLINEKFFADVEKIKRKRIGPKTLEKIKKALDFCDSSGSKPISKEPELPLEYPKPDLEKEF